MNTTERLSLILVITVLIQSSQAADIVGSVVLKGSPPPETVVDLKHPAHAAVADQHPDGLTTRHYRVNPDGGLQNVLVYIRADFDGQTFEKPSAAVVLDHVDGLFQPYVMGIQVGQSMQLKCSDGTICSYSYTGGRNRPFTTMPGGDVVSRTFTVPEPTPVRLGCDLHPWNFAYVRVFSHPYFAVTDEQGNFTIKDVPEGRYTVEVFHLKAGKSTQPVVVGDELKPVSFELEAK